MLIGFLASACSALTGGIIKFGVDKFFSRLRPDSATNVGVEVSGSDVENSTRGRVNSDGEASGAIEISAHLGVVSSTPTPAPQSPSTPSTPQQSR